MAAVRPSPRVGHSFANPEVTLPEEVPIEVLRHRWAKRSPLAFDMHFGLEVGVVLEGEMIRHYRNGRSVHGPGEPWFHNLWESHGWEVRRVPSDALVLIIDPRTLQQLRFHEAPDFSFLAPFTALPGQRPQVSAGRRPEVLDLARAILRHHDAGGPLARLQVHVLLLRLILVACEEWAPPRAAPGDAGSLPRSIEPALRLVADSRRFLPVGQAARACGIGVKAFRSTFSSLMGTSFPRYALKYRCDGVARQLLESDDPVKAIAVDWGFTDTSHLDHAFRRFFGCFPTEYRARHRG